MTIRILTGDCLEVMKTLPDSSVDSVVTDPPYGIRFMGKAWDGADIERVAKERAAHPSRRPNTGPNGGHHNAALSAGKYDLAPAAMRAFQEFSFAWATEAMRVLKPGGHLLSFASTRTYHRMASGIEDAGFEIRDQIGWLFGSGFPKSKNLTGDWHGWGTALKPAWEPICVARKPLDGTVAANVLKHGTGALNIDGCRIQTSDDLNGGAYNEAGNRTVSGSLNPSGMNVAGATVGTPFVQPIGRWPANLMHDGRDEVVALFPESAGQLADASSSSSSRKTQNVYGSMKRGNSRDGESSAESQNDGSVGFKLKPGARRGDSGSAARFFWCPKTSSADRHDGLQHPGNQFEYGSTPRDSEKIEAGRKGNHHPTVKPTELMRYLCRLVTPPGGTVLDPFAGSGSTLKAAELEGFSAIGIELDPAYVEIAKRRIGSDAPLFAEVQA